MTVSGKRRLVHRMAWIDKHGPIPEGQEVRHKCDNRLCCNVDHLELGTRSDNMRDMVDRGRCANTAAKLTGEQVGEIKRRLETGTELHKDIAADYGISRTIVTRINNGKIWQTYL
jgi:hypothetical protein